MLKQLYQSFLKWFISSKWGEKLPSVFHQVAGAAVPSVAGLVKKPVVKKRKLDLVHLVNIQYSQTLHSEGEGLRWYIQDAMDMVEDAQNDGGPNDLMPNNKICKAFLKQNVAKTAAESCMVISPYIYFLMAGVRMPAFQMYLIESINRRVVTADKLGNFCWLPKRSIGLARVWKPDVREVEFKHNPNFTNVDDMVLDFKKTGLQIGLIRKGNSKKPPNTHTHLCYMQDGELRNADQYHHDETGRLVKNRYLPGGPNKAHRETLWYLYAYK